jgi:acetyl-CoA synthetase
MSQSGTVIMKRTNNGEDINPLNDPSTACFLNSQKYEVLANIAEKSWIDMNKYKSWYEWSIKDPEGFWKKAAEMLDWFRGFTDVRLGSFEEGDINWFINGKLNACWNCVDRHLPTKANQVAILYEADEPNHDVKITYSKLHKEVCRLANVLKRHGIRKGDGVCIYLPTIPEAIYSMLACARIGAIHSVVFAGFSSDSLAARIQDANCKIVITSDESLRGGRHIHLKKFTDEALKSCPTVEKVIVVQHTKSKDITMQSGRDIWFHEAMEKERPVCPCESMDSEDPLFLLYTSGSTGTPKGVLHTTAGYLLFTTFTHRYVFDYHDGDIHACVADVGWITGHSYMVYGPLSNGATTVLFDSVPTYPTPSRYWEMVEKHKITIFYGAPTALRNLMKFGTDPIKKHNLSSLRILGSVGEPINPSAWEWYYQNIGNSKCTIVDTYWQTETGGVVMTPIPGVHALKPGSCVAPFFGIEPILLDEKTGALKEGNNVKGVLAFKRTWPSITRTVNGDHKRYMDVYMRPYPGYYFTGDGCYRDSEGYYFIIGRVDDVLNVSGHRLGTAELESALVQHDACAESAVVGFPHSIKGQAIFAYCVLGEGYAATKELEAELKMKIRTIIGPFATPDVVVIVPGLPKTRSGKIMRRILRKIAEKETDNLGDTSTLLDPAVVQQIIELVKILKY